MGGERNTGAGIKYKDRHLGICKKRNVSLWIVKSRQQLSGKSACPGWRGGGKNRTEQFGFI